MHRVFTKDVVVVRFGTVLDLTVTSGVSRTYVADAIVPVKMHFSPLIPKRIDFLVFTVRWRTKIAPFAATTSSFTVLFYRTRTLEQWTSSCRLYFVLSYSDSKTGFVIYPV